MKLIDSDGRPVAGAKVGTNVRTLDVSVLGKKLSWNIRGREHNISNEWGEITLTREKLFTPSWPVERKRALYVLHEDRKIGATCMISKDGEREEIKLTLEPVDPMNVVEIVLSNHSPEATMRQQILSSEIGGILPLVRADPARMTQILTNLVSNAIHYTPTGGVITVAAEVVDSFLHLHVRDTLSCHRIRNSDNNTLCGQQRNLHGVVINAHGLRVSHR